MPKLSPFEKHWRNRNPRCYYLTHSPAPIMYATGANPIHVTALPMLYPVEDPNALYSSFLGDRLAVITYYGPNGEDPTLPCCSHRVQAPGFPVEGLSGSHQNKKII